MAPAWAGALWFTTEEAASKVREPGFKALILNLCVKHFRTAAADSR